MQVNGEMHMLGESYMQQLREFHLKDGMEGLLKSGVPLLAHECIMHSNVHSIIKLPVYYCYQCSKASVKKINIFIKVASCLEREKTLLSLIGA